jgi:hypothetical protein
MRSDAAKSLWKGAYCSCFAIFSGIQGKQRAIQSGGKPRHYEERSGAATHGTFSHLEHQGKLKGIATSLRLSQ